MSRERNVKTSWTPSETGTMSSGCPPDHWLDLSDYTALSLAERDTLKHSPSEIGWNYWISRRSNLLFSRTTPTLWKILNGKLSTTKVWQYELIKCTMLKIAFISFAVERARRLFIDAKIRELGLLLPKQNEAWVQLFSDFPVPLNAAQNFPCLTNILFDKEDMRLLLWHHKLIHKYIYPSMHHPIDITKELSKLERALIVLIVH